MVFCDDTVIAFLDARPANPGHLRVAPRDHVPSLDVLDERLAAYLFRVARRMARALRTSGLRCDGVTILVADGTAASPGPSHVHLQVVPRTRDDGFRIDAQWIQPGRAELDAAAQAIRASLERLPP